MQSGSGGCVTRSSHQLAGVGRLRLPLVVFCYGCLAFVLCTVYSWHIVISQSCLVRGCFRLALIA
jgi:hypothetical protein